MGSPYARPDQSALAELEELVRHLTEELASWRRRSLRSEAELQELKSRGGLLAGPELVQVRQRIVDLETENQELRRRIDAARGRVETLSTRLLFLEEQAEAGST